MEKVKGGKEKEEVQEGLVLLWYRIFLQQHRIVFGQERKEEGTEEAKGEENQEKQEIKKTQPVEIQVTSG